MTMPAGVYYFGDLCYVMNSKWNAVCDTTIGDTCLEGEFKLADGTAFAMYGTMYGDGEYTDQHSNHYCVDSGTLGCVLVSASDKSVEEIQEEKLGNVLYIDRPFRTWSDGEIIHLAHIEINTGYPEEENY